MNSKLFTRSLTAIDRFRRNRPNHKVEKTRRARTAMRPSLDGLDARVLLAGNVTAIWSVPGSGVLKITGDPAANNIEISPSPIPGLLRVKGVATSINTVAYTDFVLSSVSSIDVTMQNKNCTVTMKDFKIPNNISYTAGTGSDKLTMTNVGANQVKVSTSSVLTDYITMNNVILTGSATIQTGTGADFVTLKGGRIGTVIIDTGGGSAIDTVLVADFASTTPGVPGIGSLKINTHDGSDSIDVNNTSLSQLAIDAGDGNNSVNVAAPFIRAATTITTGIGNDKILFTSPSAKAVSINSWAGDDTIRLNDSKLTTATIAAGTGLNTIEIVNDIFAGDLNVTAGDGPEYWTALPVFPGTILLSSSFILDNSSGIGAAKISLGNNFRDVTLGSDAASTVKAKSLDLSVGSGSNTVVMNTLIDNLEKIAIGDLQNYPTFLFPINSIEVNGSAGELQLTIGKHAGMVTVDKTVTGAESITVDNNSTIHVTGNAQSLAVALGNHNELHLGSFVTTEGSVIVAGGNHDTISLEDVTANQGGVHVIAANETDVTLTNIETHGNPAFDDGDVTVDIGNQSSVTVVGVQVNDGDFTITALAFAIVNVSNVTVVGSDVLISTGNSSTVLLNQVDAEGKVEVATGSDSHVQLMDVFAGMNVEVIAIDSALIEMIMVVAGGGAFVHAQEWASITMLGVTANEGNLEVSATDGASVFMSDISAANGDVKIRVENDASLIEVDNTFAKSLMIQAFDGDTYFHLENVSVADGSGLSLNTGDGDNTIDLINLLVLDGLFVNCGSGINTVLVDNVIADYGTINGGPGDSNLFIADDSHGPSEGFDTDGFDGFI